MNRPQPDEYAAWGSVYIDRVGPDIFYDLEDGFFDFLNLLRQHSERQDFAYAANKWTLKELAGHMIDTERILTYRLLTFARNDQTELPGFEEDDYVANASFASRDFLNLLEEFRLLRMANLHLFKSLTEGELSRTGIMAVGRRISVKGLLYAIAGHVIHHRNIVETRYL